MNDEKQQELEKNKAKCSHKEKQTYKKHAKNVCSLQLKIKNVEKWEKSKAALEAEYEKKWLELKQERKRKEELINQKFLTREQDLKRKHQRELEELNQSYEEEQQMDVEGTVRSLMTAFSEHAVP